MSDDVFAAIGDPSRRKIMLLLATEPRSVQELAAQFTVSRPAISKHLRVLREAGLVEEQQVGRQRVYRLELARLGEVREWVSYFDRFWLEKLGLLKQLVEEKDERGGSPD